MRSKPFETLVYGIAVVGFLSGAAARAMNFDNWVATSPALLDLTLNIAGSSHYAMRGAAKSAASDATSETVENGAAYFAVLTETGAGASAGASAFGHVMLFDLGTKSRAHWEETTVSEAMKEFEYWRSQQIQPTATGDFTLNRMTLRWIAFTHTSANAKRFACFGYSGAGRGVRVALRGSWCAEGAPAFGEAEIKGFVGAFGYKDILIPAPLRSAPGVGVAG